PELAAAVSSAGGLGFLASGYLSAEETGARVASARALIDRPLAVNLFVPGPRAADPAAYTPYVDRLREWVGDRGLELGQPRFHDDDWEAKLKLLTSQPVEVVS